MSLPISSARAPPLGQAYGITKPSIKVIFLDLDGVLVTKCPGIMDGNLVMNLISVVEATGAQIVLSSDWRRTHDHAQEARKQLQAYGLDFISCTPSFPPLPPQRPAEIMQWKDGDYDQYHFGQISAWIAIDDRFLLEEQQGHQLQGHFVHTHPMIGLDHAVARKCIQLLRQESADGVQSTSRINNEPQLISSASARRHTTPFLPCSIFDVHDLSSHTTPMITWTPSYTGPSSVKRILSSDVYAMDAYQQRDPFGPSVGKYAQEASNPVRVVGINSTSQGISQHSMSVTELHPTRLHGTARQMDLTPARSNDPMVPWFDMQEQHSPYHPVRTQTAKSDDHSGWGTWIDSVFENAFGA